MFKNIKLLIRLALLKRKLRRDNKFWHLSDQLENKKYVLVIDRKIPEFKKDSGSRRLTEIIKLLLKNKIGVILMADFKEYRYASEYISVFKEMGVLVYEPALDELGELITKESFLKKVLPHVNFAWLHRPEVFKKYEYLIRRENPAVKIFFDMVDFHYLRYVREMFMSKRRLVRFPDLKKEKIFCLLEDLNIFPMLTALPIFTMKSCRWYGKNSPKYLSKY